MRRPFVISTGALALALLPAALHAQTAAQQPATQPTTQQPATPAGQQPTTGGQPPATGAGQQPAAGAGQQPAAGAAAQPTEPKLGFTTPSGLLLVQVKPDQTAAFEELSAKLQTALASTTDPALKAQGDSWKIYKASEPMGGNALYVVVVDPASPGTEYNPIDVLFKTMTDEQKRAPETQEMFKRYAAAFAGVNKLNITRVGGGTGAGM